MLGDLQAGIQPLLDKYGRENAPDPALLFALSNDVRTGSTLFSFGKTFEGPFAFDVFFDSASVPSALDSTALTAGLEASRAAYDARFEATFGLKKRGYDDQAIEVHRQLTASIVGGIGYFYGSSIVDRSFAHAYDDADLATGGGGNAGRDPDPKLTEPAELFTATPSRPFFPRGFYWCARKARQVADH